MGTPALDLTQQVMLDRCGLDRPIEGIRRMDCRVAVPRAGDGAIDDDTLASVASRPGVWMVEQEPATRHQVFEAPGCVGCGWRMTWCPAAIDLGELALALHEGVAQEETSHANA